MTGASTTGTYPGVFHDGVAQKVTHKKGPASGAFPDTQSMG